MTHFCAIAEARDKMPCMEQCGECYRYEHEEDEVSTKLMVFDGARCAVKTAELIQRLVRENARLRAELEATAPINEPVAAQENKAEAASSGADFKATDLGAGIAAPSPSSRSLPNNSVSAAAPVEDLTLPEVVPFLATDHGMVVWQNDYDSLLSIARKLKERINLLEQAGATLLMANAENKRKLAEAERRAQELHDNGERLKEAADGWKQEAERLRGIESALFNAEQRAGKEGG